MTSGQQVALQRAHRGGANHLSKTTRQVVPPFLQKLYEIVNNPDIDDLVRWSEPGDSFFVLDHERFAKEVLGCWFKHQNFPSFVRQLNMYGFHKIPHLQQGVLRSDNNETEIVHFEHPNFRRGQPDLLCFIQRKKQTAQGGEETMVEVRDPVQAPPPGGNLSAGQILDINAIVSGIAAIKRHQTTISADLNDLKESNQLLWQEAMTARERHKKHQDTINRILKFLAGVFGHSSGSMHKDDGRNTPSRVVVPRNPQRLLIEDGRNSKGVKVTELHEDVPESQLAFLREQSTMSTATMASSQFPSVRTPASTAISPSIAPSDILSPTAAIEDISSGSTPTPLPFSSPQAQVPVEPIPTSTLTTLTTTTTPQNSDAVLQSILSQVLQSPGQMQKLLASLSSQPSYPLPDPPNQASDTQSQLTTFDSQPDFLRSFDSGEDNSIYPSTLLAPASPTADLTSLDSLAEDTACLQKTYQDTAEIDADVNALHTSINSLIESLGMDPTLLSASSPKPEELVPPPSEMNDTSPTIGSSVLPTDTTVSTPPPDFDFDAFLTEFSRDGESQPDYGEFAEKLEASRGTAVTDPPPEQLTAFLDEVALQSDHATSPLMNIESPVLAPSRNSRKRKSDGVIVPDDVGAKASKTKRKR